MSDEPDSLILVCLRRLDSEIDALKADMGEVKGRLTAVEIAVASLSATQMSQYVSLAGRLDRLESRLDRVERRTDIISA